jgi:hypothetical protein
MRCDYENCAALLDANNFNNQEKKKLEKSKWRCARDADFSNLKREIERLGNLMTFEVGNINSFDEGISQLILKI